MLSVVVDIVIVAATLAVTPFLVHALGVEPYGIIGLVSVLSGQLAILQFGTGVAATRLIAASRGRGEDAAQTTITRAAIALGALSGAVAGLVFTIAAPSLWRRALGSAESQLSIALGSVGPAALVIAAQPLIASVTGSLLGHERFAFLSGFRLTHGVARVLVPAYVVSRGGGVASVLVAQAAVDFVAVAGGAAALWGTSRPSVDFFAVSRRVLAVGAPFAAGGALAMLLTDGEKLIIGLAGSLENFTYYSVPFNASYRLTALASALSSVLLPRIAWAVGAGDSAAAAHIARRATRMTVGGMALLLAPLIGIAPDILRLWLGEDFAAHASWPARIILVGLLANTAAFTPHAVVRAVAAPSTLTVLYACELPVYLAAVWILVPVLGPAGAALGWATRVLTDALLLAWIAGRALDRPVIAAREVVLPLSMLAGLALACEVLGDGAPAAARAVISLGIGTSIWIALWTRDDRKLVLRLLRPPEHERG